MHIPCGTHLAHACTPLKTSARMARNMARTRVLDQVLGIGPSGLYERVHLTTSIAAREGAVGLDIRHEHLEQALTPRTPPALPWTHTTRASSGTPALVRPACALSVVLCLARRIPTGLALGTADRPLAVGAQQSGRVIAHELDPARVGSCRCGRACRWPRGSRDRWCRRARRARCGRPGYSHPARTHSSGSHHAPRSPHAAETMYAHLGPCLPLAMP